MLVYIPKYKYIKLVHTKYVLCIEEKRRYIRIYTYDQRSGRYDDALYI